MKMELLEKKYIYWMCGYFAFFSMFSVSIADGNWPSSVGADGPPNLPQTFRGQRPVLVNNTLMLGNETLSFHPTQDENSPYAVSQYSITCCRNGTPTPDANLEQYIHEWSQEMVGVERNKSCRRFNGYYSVPTWVLQQQKSLVVGVRCKCPDDGTLDRNCRYLPDCANGGYRSFSINLRCVCPPQWFGDLCEKFCLNGALYKDFASGGNEDGLGVDRCKCMKNFYGEACDEVQCFNGGTPVKGRGCLCQPPYIGPHCEEMAGVGQFDAPTSSSFHRDLSSTVVSLFLAVALALGVYFLVRRRTQWMRRRMQARRAMMIGAVDGTHSSPGGESTSASGPPPMYYRTLANQQSSVVQPTNTDTALYDISGLPPPPAYHDIVKIPPAYVDARSQQSTVQNAPAPVNESSADSVEPETPSSSSAAPDSVQTEAQSQISVQQGSSVDASAESASTAESGDPNAEMQREQGITHTQNVDRGSSGVHVV